MNKTTPHAFITRNLDDSTTASITFEPFDARLTCIAAQSFLENGKNTIVDFTSGGFELVGGKLFDDVMLELDGELPEFVECKVERLNENAARVAVTFPLTTVQLIEHIRAHEAA